MSGNTLGCVLFLISFLLELHQAIYHSGVEEGWLYERWLIYDHFDAFGLDAYHDGLDAAWSEIIRASFHDQAVVSDDFRFAFEYPGRDKIFACGVVFDDGVGDVLRDIIVIVQKLFGALG